MLKILFWGSIYSCNSATELKSHSVWVNIGNCMFSKYADAFLPVFPAFFNFEKFIHRTLDK